MKGHIEVEQPAQPVRLERIVYRICAQRKAPRPQVWGNQQQRPRLQLPEEPRHLRQLPTIT